MKLILTLIFSSLLLLTIPEGWTAEPFYLSSPMLDSPKAFINTLQGHVENNFEAQHPAEMANFSITHQIATA